MLMGKYLLAELGEWRSAKIDEDCFCALGYYIYVYEHY